jgi:hypothetical protein
MYEDETRPTSPVLKPLDCDEVAYLWFCHGRNPWQCVLAYESVAGCASGAGLRSHEWTRTLCAQRRLEVSDAVGEGGHCHAKSSRDEERLALGEI